MSDFGDALATLFTFLTFLLIIIAPMALAFFKAKADSAEKAKQKGESDTSKQKGKRKKAKPRSAGKTIFEMFREANRQSEPEVKFSTPRKEAARKPEPAEEEKSYTNRLGSETFDSGFRSSFDEGKSPGKYMPEIDYTQEKEPPGQLPPSRASQRLLQLTELQRAVVLSEVLGPPKGLE